MFPCLYGKVEVDGMINAHIKDAVALCDWAATIQYEIQVSICKLL
jgi:hypothetical protein